MIEHLILFALASQRLVFLWLTQRVFGQARIGISWLGPGVASFVNCPVCLSVWFSGILYAIWHLSWVGQFIVWMLAISMTGVIINAVTQYLEAWAYGRKV